VSKKRSKKRKPFFKFPLGANLDANVEYARKNVKEKRVLEFVPNRVKNGEAIIVRIKRWAGLREACFVVSNNNGKITIEQVIEEKEERKEN